MTTSIKWKMTSKKNSKMEDNLNKNEQKEDNIKKEEEKKTT